MLTQDTQVRRDILLRAAQIANKAHLPPEAAVAGAIFREADRLSSFEYMTLSYDTDIFTGMDPNRVQAVDAELRLIAQEAIRLAIIEQGEDFVSLILAGARGNTHYLSSTL
jgi:hypothetical protein